MTSNPTPIGSTISHYRILGLLGMGGMGTVYRARDERLDRDVALKVLLPATADDVTAKARLLREARMASSLNHPHIAHVYEVGEDREHLFIAMELVEGRTLRDSIPSGGLPPETVLRLGLQIADALCYAHKKGVIHRDLKAANIMLTPGGTAKVLDFGLAKRLSIEGEPEQEPDLSLTATGILVGTPTYLPPEVLRGEPADARSDIWAFGVVLYEMASGRLPFDRSSFHELSDAILNGAPAPLSGRVPSLIQAVIGRCLAKDPSQRYYQGSEVRAAIEALIGGTSPKRVRVPRLVWIPAAILAAGVLMTALAIGTGVVRNPLVKGGGHPKIRSLAVLPLANLSGDPAQEYFADGMTEELITVLASIPSLKVTSRTSTMRFKNSKQTLREIAKSLGVDAVVEGSVQRAGDRVRITAQLIEASGDNHLWAKSVERDFRDVLTIQSEVARDIAKEIEIRVSPGMGGKLASRRPVNPQAYELYLKGRFEWAKLTDERIRKSIEYFEQARALDPDDPRYSSGLADAYVVLVQVVGSVPKTEGMKKVKEYARQALAADENSAEAHTSMAAGLFFGDWNAVEAEKHVLRAIELNPSYSTAHLVYSVILAASDRLNEAIEQDRQAIALDPFSLIIHWNASGTLFLARRYDQALAAANRALEVDPSATRYWAGGRLRVYEQTGNYEAALDVLDQHLPEEEGGKARAAQMRQAYQARGPAGYWQSSLDHALAMDKVQKMDPVQMAFLYAQLGDHSRALDYLERAFRERNGDCPFLIVQPGFDPLRKEPRFQALVDRLRPRLLPAPRS